jgi:DNA repair protein RadC
LANIGSSASNDGVDVTFCSKHWREHGVLCNWDNSGFLGISSTCHPNVRSTSKFKGAAANVSEIEYLADILTRPLGAKARGIAMKLLEEYHSISAILMQAPVGFSAKLNVPSMVSPYLSRLGQTLLDGWKSQALNGQIIASSENLLNYLQLEMGSLQKEHFRVLFLDPRNHLIADETLWIGTVNEVQIHPREIIARALALSATAMILVHNHPNGDSRPSGNDAAVTEKVATACAALGIKIWDHLIIGQNKVFSLAENRNLRL